MYNCIVGLCNWIGLKSAVDNKNTLGHFMPVVLKM